MDPRRDALVRDNLSLVVVKIEALQEEKKMGRLSPISSKTA